MLRYKTSMRSDKHISTTEKCLCNYFLCFVSYASMRPTPLYTDHDYMGVVEQRT